MVLLLILDVYGVTGSIQGNSFFSRGDMKNLKKKQIYIQVFLFDLDYIFEIIKFLKDKFLMD